MGTPTGLGSLTLQIKQRRKAIDITQEELAHRSGVRQGSISKMEQGTIERVGLEVLVRLAHGLGLDSPFELFDWQPGPRFAKWQK